MSHFHQEKWWDYSQNQKLRSKLCESRDAIYLKVKSNKLIQDNTSEIILLKSEWSVVWNGLPKG